ncbi:hypothetical protein [Fluviicola sp.]|uniref:hypothetical protein n=1 Tax=Fluviicola sp. TaxID=1917219 RepID=UPI0031E0981E
MTITNFKKTRIFKITNILLIYALLLNITVPFAQTMNGLLTVSISPDYTGMILPGASSYTAVAEEQPVLVSNEMEAVSDRKLELPETEQVQKLAAVSTTSAGGSGFSLNTGDDLVDPFTGDFSYSIPLMDVEGYPIALSYNSKVNMNTEASWVGLGWNLNVGSVEREMRGIPDEFDGSQSVTRETNQLDDNTTNGYKKGKYWSGGADMNLVNYANLNLEYSNSKLNGTYNNTYLGSGTTYDKSSGWSVGAGGTIYFVGLNIGGSWGHYYSYDSKRGINTGAGGGLSGGISVFGVGANFSTYSSTNFNSREGMTGKTIIRGWGVGATYTSEWGGSASSALSFSHTSTIPYGSQTQVPRVQLNSTNFALSNTIDRYFVFGASAGPYATFGATFGKLKQFYTSLRSEIKNGNTIIQPAIGYLHSSRKMVASGYTLPIMDFNRSNDTRYSEAMTTLPFSMQTFDIFHANAMGMQGTFRAHRTDAGTYLDANATDNGLESSSVDKKGGSLITYEKEIGYGFTKENTSSNNFRKPNGTNVLEFMQGSNLVNGFDNAVYFKGVGETTPVDASLYKNLGGLSASRATLLNDGENIALQEVMVPNTGPSYTLPPDGKVTLFKPTVATYFRPRTASELTAAPNDYEKNYYSYSKNYVGIIGGGANPVITPILRTTNVPNVISRVEITGADGVFYGYGIPSFSNTSSQVLFNIGSNSGAPSIVRDAQGLITYSAGDNSVSNSKGLAHYYDKTTVPAYAESFLLTDMYGSDYVDRTGNGPTPDDMGMYFKFNYTRLYEHYHWRFPVGNQKAFYMEGTVGSELDDMASYSAGDKEVWVTHSVESKNYIAEFVLDATPRLDGYGINESGVQISGEPTYALKQIKLYARADRKTSGSAAIPLQIVEFTYNYELCQNYPANYSTTSGQKGKLTLKAVTVYSGKSFENQHSSYQFDYGTGSVANPDFNYATIDAWGELKPGDPTFISRFPYVVQSQVAADNNAQAWRLKKIISPNGGSMTISYESDRYGFVQKKRVMKHMDFEGLTNIYDLFSMKNNNVLDASKIRQTMNTSAMSISPYAAAASLISLVYNLFYGRFAPSQVPNNIVVFELETPIPVSNTAANEKVKKDYFTDNNGTVMKELYLKAHMRVTDSDTRTEIVPLFAAISNDLTNALSNTYPIDDAPAIGVLPPASGSSDYTYGYVVLTPYKVRNPSNEDLDEGTDILNDNISEDEAFNPIQKAAFDFFQRSLTDIVYQNTAFSTGLNALDLLTGARMDISKAMRRLGFGSTLMDFYNTMRVYIPSNIKYGGGARVKSIEFSDNWQAISGEYNSNYKIDYLYDFAGKTSGVASYESRIANDESDFYQWDSYYDIRVRYPDKFNYTPKPAMEILYPSGSIGYSKVTSMYNNLTDRGYEVTEFYTAWDKPTLESTTGLDKQKATFHKKNKGVLSKIYAFSQGFSLETNDFHGKIKSNAIYKGSLAEISNDAITANLLSKTTYNYFNAGEKQKLANEKGEIEEMEVGIDYDIHADSRYIAHLSRSFYAAVKKVWNIPSIVPAPNLSMNSSFSLNAFVSHVLVKHANRSAILKSVETEYMGSKNLAENLVFDRYSGGVIVSSLNDEFDDKLYSLNYPAHWYYSELRNISSSQNMMFPLTLGSNTTITDPLSLKLLSPGDVLKFPDERYAWVTKAYPWPTTPKYFLIDEYGNEFSIAAGVYNVIIHKSGRNNEVFAAMQAITTKKDPLTATQINFPATDILSGGAVTLRDRLNVLCKTGGYPDVVNNNNTVGVGIVNPYKYGIRGDLVLDNNLSWQDSRVQATTTNGVRKDGAYSSFVPYYAKTSAGDWYPLTHPSHPNYSATLGIDKWRKSGEGTVYNQYGAQIEVKDPLRINSALLYGYNPKLQILPVAVAQNAHKQDIVFDGFEDYFYYTSQLMDDYEPHFSFTTDKSYKVEIANDVRHSGKSSVRVAPAKVLTATRSIKAFQEAKTVHADNTTNTGQTKSCDCINNFSPTPGEYVVGAWLRQRAANTGIIKVEILDASNTSLLLTTFGASGTALDGWQRIEGTFTIPAGAATINVYLVNNAASDGTEVYFDDFRIHPFQASMATTVYDPVTLLKIASHDGNNYTTFYNYDENNQLVRVRVETAEGIKTISESEMSVYKQP